MQATIWHSRTGNPKTQSLVLYLSIVTEIPLQACFLDVLNSNSWLCPCKYAIHIAIPTKDRSHSRMSLYTSFFHSIRTVPFSYFSDASTQRSQRRRSHAYWSTDQLTAKVNALLLYVHKFGFTTVICYLGSKKLWYEQWLYCAGDSVLNVSKT